MTTIDLPQDAIPLSMTQSALTGRCGSQHVLCFAPRPQDAFDQFVEPTLLQAFGSYVSIFDPEDSVRLEARLLPYLLACGYTDVRERCEDAACVSAPAAARELVAAPGFINWEPASAVLNAVGLPGFVRLLDGPLPVTMQVDARAALAGDGLELAAALDVAPANLRVCVLARGVRTLEALCGSSWPAFADAFDHLLFLGAQRGSTIRELGVEGLAALEDGQAGVSWRERALVVDEPLTARTHPRGAEAQEALRVFIERAEREAEEYIAAHPEG